jgi:hypothetical protein
MSKEAQPFPEDLARPDESAEALDTDELLDRYDKADHVRHPPSGGRRSGIDPRGGPQPGSSHKHEASSQ